jgi:hypothetical protein
VHIDLFVAPKTIGFEANWTLNITSQSKKALIIQNSKIK